MLTNFLNPVFIEFRSTQYNKAIFFAICFCVRTTVSLVVSIETKTET